MFKRQGITLDRSMLSAWVCLLVATPLYELVLGIVLSSDKKFANETGPRLFRRIRGRTDVRPDLRCHAFRKILLAFTGASTDVTMPGEQLAISPLS
jgi:hypothetical protein